ncbi:MAG: DUF4390 domain-containing protein [Wenzhouxiangella sp.]|nr:DUF4390 domain-containing protein [Wenzhouxiangella sp.]
MVFISLLLSGCDRLGDGGGGGDASRSDLALSLSEPAIEWRGDVLGVATGVVFAPSAAILEALEHGVAVNVVVATRIHPWHGALASASQTRNHRFEIRYLPLIEHHQLTELKTGQTESFPRLSMLLEALSQRHWLDTHLSRDDVGDTAWQVQARVDIDREQLPAPMQLSAWRDRNWRSGQAWLTWRVERDDHAP